MAHGNSNPSEQPSIEQALSQADYDTALSGLSSQYVRIMGEDAAARIKSLADSLPDNVTRDNLWVNVGAAVACEMLRSYERQREFMDNAFRIAGWQDGQPDPESDVSAEERMAVCIMRMLRDYHDGGFEKAIELGNKELDRLGSQGHYAKSGLLCLLGMAHWARGDAAKAHDCWRMGANFAMFSSWIYSLCLEQFGTARAHFAQNQLKDAAEICQRVFAISDQGENPVLASCYAHLLMARVHYDRNRLDRAESEVNLALSIAETGPEQTLYLDAETALAHLDAANGRQQSAADRANRCMAKFARARQREGLEGARSMMAGIWTHVGMPRMASDCLDLYWGFDLLKPREDVEVAEILGSGLFGDDFRNVWSTPPLLELLRLRIHEGQTAGVMLWLDRIGREAVHRGLSRLLLESLVLKALCSHVEEHEQEALNYLKVSLMIAESEHCVRVFADEGPLMEELLVAAHRARMSSRFLDEVFAATRGENVQAADVETAFGETFTKRELDVMRALYGGATNAEIAQRLYLGLSTVKNYTHSIYQKLGVRNRAEAIVRIGQLHIVD